VSNPVGNKWGKANINANILHAPAKTMDRKYKTFASNYDIPTNLK